MKKSVENFLKYGYNGDGKYYTTEQGSRNYRNTEFSNFWSKNIDAVKVIDKGNDAPRGGKTGDYVIVEFTPEFKETAEKYLTKLRNAKIVVEKAKESKSAAIQSDIDKVTPIVDDQYRSEVKEANLLSGLEKSEARKSALKSLLERSNIEVTYFFEVMKAI